MIEVELLGGPRDGSTFALDHTPEDAPRELVFAVSTTGEQRRAWLRGELDPADVGERQRMTYRRSGVTRASSVLVYALVKQPASV